MATYSKDMLENGVSNLAWGIKELTVGMLEGTRDISFLVLVAATPCFIISFYQLHKKFSPDQWNEAIRIILKWKNTGSVNQQEMHFLQMVNDVVYDSPAMSIHDISQSMMLYGFIAWVASKSLLCVFADDK